MPLLSLLQAFVNFLRKLNNFSYLFFYKTDLPDSLFTFG